MTTNAMDTRYAGLLRIILLLLLTMATGSRAQFHSLTASFDYTIGGATRLSVERISAFGGSVHLAVRVHDAIVIAVQGGYASYAIDQSDQLAGWNWNFWNERYYPKIQADMRADPSLSVVIGSVQKMNTIPVRIAMAYHHPLHDDLMLVPAIGGGVVFYTRKLYAEETWTKVFPTAQYAFMYSFRNFAPEKKGTVPLLFGGCDIRYRLSTDIRLIAGAMYTHYTPFNGADGYGDFPLKSEFKVAIGLSFEY